jgi:hypothetical protein
MKLTFCAAAILVIIAASPALAETLVCSTSSQGYRVCSSPGGYHLTEWRWRGMTLGQDSDGSRWTTSRWMGVDITTIEPR